MRSALAIFKELWTGLPDGVKRVIHTFIQAFVSSIIVGAIAVRDLSTAKAVIIAAVAAGIAAVKAALVAAK